MFHKYLNTFVASTQKIQLPYGLISMVDINPTSIRLQPWQPILDIDIELLFCVIKKIISPVPN
jgi:hypothetical protein